jgi:hypothetical protein
MTLDLRPAPQDLSGDSLFQLIRSRFDTLSDPRAREVEIPLGDALMSAFAMFSLKDPSLLAFDQRRRNPQDNFRTLYGITHVPSDTQMRSLLDPLDPTELRPVFRDFFRRVQRSWNASSTSMAIIVSLVQNFLQLPKETGAKHPGDRSRMGCGTVR